MFSPLKIYYCPPRPGDVWPPRESKGATASQKPASRQKTAKPPDCKKLYAGNLSYCIDDEAITEFFKDCGTMVGLRWLTRQGTEEFRVSRKYT
jgi:nucleolin